MARYTKKNKEIIKSAPIPTLPSGHLCEALDSSYPVHVEYTDSDSKFKDRPYYINIVWACYSRKYRYQSKQDYETDLSILLALSAKNKK